MRSDVLVIGAGAIGASAAFHLARAGLDVTVLEAFSGPAQGSTGRSFACVRVRWADPVNILMTWRSIRDCFQRYEAGYFPHGYVLLVPEHAWGDHLASVDLQHQLGVPVEILDVPSAQRLTPFSPEGVGGGTLGPADGVVDPHLLTTLFPGRAKDLGARVLFSHRVTSIESDDGWAVTAGERTFHAQHVVNAAGGWSGEVAVLAGLEVPVCHLRRNIYATAPGASTRKLPMTVDVATGAFLRSEGDRVLFGLSRPDETPGYQTIVDWSWMEQTLIEATGRFPWLADHPLDQAACWAGTYEAARGRGRIR
ncbi:FAD-binding oxidoreductase [Kibdelosporangium philippinense]|uniref:FAD-binding oxidoreductase n=1 Tax=Kibdelosporangium philippinense TaxID=211113 RepID=A0ABS8Z923_9PSEU|nr:FAD-dependent oxidoreductase [Kibdelosporangium philippinense]MCE7003048.1 FAD-binding oxidoreductase [Kibdelosporangium philippinense]